MQQTIQHGHGSYPLVIDTNWHPTLNALTRHKKVCIITDETVQKHHLPSLLTHLPAAHVITLPPGEAQKTLSRFESITTQLIEFNFHRDDLLIALGGGVVGDLTGFVAACYYRGINWIQMPTTLLAQVDASIGGKTAINHTLGKNLIGAFHPPIAVIINPNTLHTLPNRIYRQGLAEIIKIALIMDADFFTWLETHIDALLAQKKHALIECIFRATQLKAQIVQQDEKEHGKRALLNFGHTFAHAIETVEKDNDWQHGEAVALGIMAASWLSKQHGLGDTDFGRIQNIIQKTGLLRPLPPTIEHTKLITTMQRDKKVLDNQLRLILLKKIGRAFISNNESIATIKDALTQLT